MNFKVKDSKHYPFTVEDGEANMYNIIEDYKRLQRLYTKEDIYEITNNIDLKNKYKDYITKWVNSEKCNLELNKFYLKLTEVTSELSDGKYKHRSGDYDREFFNLFAYFYFKV